MNTPQPTNSSQRPVTARILASDCGDGWKPYGVALDFHDKGYPVFVAGFQGPAHTAEIAAAIASEALLNQEWLENGFGDAVAFRLRRVAHILRGDKAPLKQRQELADELENVAVALAGKSEDFNIS